MMCIECLLIINRPIKKDYKKAISWIRKAAEQDLANAQYILGDLYYSGDGVKKDYNEAVKWYKKAAMQGNQKAIDNLKRLGYQ